MQSNMEYKPIKKFEVYHHSSDDEMNAIDNNERLTQILNDIY